MTLEEANQLVLGYIGRTEEPTIAGFLPLAGEEEDSVLATTRVSLLGECSIRELLRVAPASTVYGLAVAPSRSLTEGGMFWPALERDLGLTVTVNQREDLSIRFRKTCRLLGLLDGTLEEAGFRLAAPFIFQAGISHHWKDALASALKGTLARFPAPDVDDSESLRRFVSRLGERIFNQPNLKRILETTVGPLLVVRLVKAYVRQDWAVLPPHLQEPIRQAFVATGGGAVLRSPFLRFDDAFRELQLVLPVVSSKLATAEGYWVLEGHRYGVRKETVIPISELDGAEATIELRGLSHGRDSQRFRVRTQIDEATPFRVFRAETGRERTLVLAKELDLTPGAYVMLTVLDVTTNEEELVEERGHLRILRFEVRPGDHPLVVCRGENSWSLRPALTAGIYVDRTRAHVTALENGELLHYGSEFSG
jgi:hypothetical protein